MASLDLEYLDKLVNRFKGYKSPNEAQQLIILLGQKSNRGGEDDKKLLILLRAEKKFEQLMLARKAANNLINKEKAEKRKIETRKKIIWGSAITELSKNYTDVAKTMVRLFESDYISAKDKELIKADYDKAKKVELF